jgi:ribonuclease BN (tRNA processing enzyme)
MHLTFIGSGYAFTVDGNYNSNMLLEAPNKAKLLIDCGSDARHALHALGYSHRDIQHVYISHLHADHVGGLEWLAFTSKFDPKGDLPKPALYMDESLVPKLWKNVISGGLESLKNMPADISNFFEVVPIKQGSFAWEGITFELVKTIHIMSNEAVMPSYGLFFTVDQVNVFITTDTQFSVAHYQKYYEKADIIFHDCETTAKKSNVHPHYSDLITLPPHIKNKMWLYHYNDGLLPNAQQDGFKGFVKKGQRFDLTD